MVITTPLVLSEVRDSGVGGGSKYGILSMNRPGANAFSRELIEAILEALDAFEADPAVNGFIWTSAVPNFFSAGIDPVNFIGTLDEWDEYWKLFRSMFLRVYDSRLVSVAAIPGHAWAGGAIMAMACHYRFMISGPFEIGMTEVALGLPVPNWVCQAFIQTVGNRTAEQLLTLGRKVPAQQSKEDGFVDEVVPSIDALMDMSVKQMVSCFEVDQFARSQTMAFLRGNVSKTMRAEECTDVEFVRGAVGGKEFQAKIRQLIATLAAQKKP